MLHFLGLGAQKAGTSWLHTQLARHAQIGFPRGKEVHFWDREPAQEDIPAYLAAFRDPARYEGDITPAYAILEPERIRQVHEAVPQARLIFVMRNPLERAWSSALMALGRAEMRIHEASDQWFLDHFRSQGSLLRGDYASCIRHWRQRFPEEQLLLLRFEDIAARPERLLAQCCEHIGVRPMTDAEIAECRRPVFAGPRHPLRPSLVAPLLELYRPRVAALEELLGEDFGAWLDTAGGAAAGAGE